MPDEMTLRLAFRPNCWLLGSYPRSIPAGKLDRCWEIFFRPFIRAASLEPTR